ncbi:MAG TPA: sigma-54-dependent Fis family transcriptional regulator [candidate division Zixibacteria bacterium]|nr:sigma-54-dependent Fis family transcriptional regulator [candidate division Zixibacteria bacterium]
MLREFLPNIGYRSSYKMKNILLVDDDPQVSETLVGLFDQDEFRFHQLEDGTRALEFIDNNSLDLVLLDVNLPSVSGLDILKEIKKADAQLPVIVISGYVSTENAIEAMKEGAYEYITKPFQIERLMMTINKAVGDRHDHDENPLVEPLPQTRDYEIVGKSPEIVEIAKMIGQVARSDAAVLVFGESGTGKELVARAIHRNSNRSEHPFLSVNCAALTESLLESELFGHEKGAFTGAYARKLGKFELANQGTLFLDEIGDMSLATQSKLLRALQEKTFERVGGESSIKVDVRLIAATNKSLVTAMKDGKFRVDLFYRLKVVTIYIPSLRERRTDVPILAEHFINQYSYMAKKNVKGISDEAMDMLIKYHWPGNVRELENNIHTAVVMSKGDHLQPEDFPIFAETGENIKVDFDEIKDNYGRMFDEFLDPQMPRILNVSSGQVFYHLQSALEKVIISKTLQAMKSNQVKTAEILGISRNTLRDRMQKYDLF